MIKGNVKLKVSLSKSLFKIKKISLGFIMLLLVELRTDILYCLGAAFVIIALININY